MLCDLLVHTVASTMMAGAAIVELRAALNSIQVTTRSGDDALEAALMFIISMSLVHRLGPFIQDVAGAKVINILNTHSLFTQLIWLYTQTIVPNMS